jgi:hypothetical protein
LSDDDTFDIDISVFVVPSSLLKIRSEGIQNNMVNCVADYKTKDQQKETVYYDGIGGM